MNVRGLGLVAAALTALPACAVDRAEFDTLREQVRLQQRIINDLKARQEGQTLRVDTIANGFKILGDKAEENSARIDDLAEIIGERAGPVPPERPAQPSAPAPAPPAAPDAPPAPGPGPVAAAVPPAPATAAPAPAAPSPVLLTNRPAGEADADEVIGTSAKPDKVYVRALETFNRREYAAAAEQFRDFVATFPEHILAGNAQYWIGECFYTQKRFAEAAEEFGAVERRYPAHRKVPDALLKKGLALRELRRTAEATAALEKILAKHPQSEASAKARELLARWK